MNLEDLVIPHNQKPLKMIRIRSKGFRRHFENWLPLANKGAICESVRKYLERIEHMKYVSINDFIMMIKTNKQINK